MSDTALFAPQVKSVQPAFIYTNNTGAVRIYYALSDFNKNLTGYSIKYKVINPNISSGWGANEIKSGTTTKLSDSNGDYIKINFYSSDEKKLITNQYYQVQIQFVKEENVSPWSQVSFIRPISSPSLVIGLRGEKSGDLYKYLSGIDGYVKYEDNTTIEQIQNYSIYIKKGEDILFKDENIKNNLGLSFSYAFPKKMYFPTVSSGSYKLVFSYTTINGFTPQTQSEIEFNFYNTSFTQTKHASAQAFEGDDDYYLLFKDISPSKKASATNNFLDVDNCSVAEESGEYYKYSLRLYLMVLLSEKLLQKIRITIMFINDCLN